MLSTLFLSQSVLAAEQTIDMLNKLGKEHMVYSKKIVKIEIGDTIFWKAKTRGHNVEFIGLPKGAPKYKSKISKEANNDEKAAIIGAKLARDNKIKVLIKGNIHTDIFISQCCVYISRIGKMELPMNVNKKLQIKPY